MMSQPVIIIVSQFDSQTLFKILIYYGKIQDMGHFSYFDSQNFFVVGRQPGLNISLTADLTSVCRVYSEWC